MISEFRKDLVSGDWVLVVSGRKSRPSSFAKSKAKQSKKTRQTISKKNCPFENPQKSGSREPIVWYPSPKMTGKDKGDLEKNWFIQVIPNKYPILDPYKSCPQEMEFGPYEILENSGFHEVIITRDHLKTIDKMSIDEASLVIEVYQSRYKDLRERKCVKYILIFHNEGELAGATIAHPHSQLVALPVIPSDVSKSINGSRKFFKKHKKCVHCVMLDWERKEVKRIIFENDYFIALAPYVSRVSYEIRIFPKKHETFFENMSEKKRPFFAEALQESLRRLSKVLHKPDYNFFIHTSPSKKEDHYHWHVEILPRVSKWAGIELGIGIEVIATTPEEAAEDLSAEG